MKSTIVKAFSSIIIVIIVTQFAGISIATTKSQLKSQQSTLNNKIKETQENLQEIKSEKSAAMKEVEELIAQISEFESEIDKLNNQINDINIKIQMRFKKLSELHVGRQITPRHSRVKLL